MLAAVLLLAIATIIIVHFVNNSFSANAVDKGTYVSNSKVGYSAEYLGTVARKTPEVSNGGLEQYPVYGTTLAVSGTEEKEAIIAEANSLKAGSTYDSMDKDGNLYLNGESTGLKLYKHSASVGMYYGDVSDDEPALIKRIHLQARTYGNLITGLYAPAGEVVKIEISAEDLAKTGGLKIIIGQALQNGQSNNIWSAREIIRMPIIDNQMTITTEVGYVGSFLGGPIYVQPVNQNTEFTVTISGAVAYSHFILGYTSEEEFEMNAASSAPYFDLEVWDGGVRHSGPKKYAEQFDYDQLTDAAVLWDKIASVSNQVPSCGNTQVLTFLYDPFVAAGAAVAFVSRGTVNCPPDWMANSLNYEGFVKSGGWGCVHEFNHHHESYGFETNTASEIVNNATSLVSYALFTNISAARTLDGSLGDWNFYTVPSSVLTQIINTSATGSTNTSVGTYANVLYSFGADAYIKAAQLSSGGGVDKWFKALCDATHYDMTYYFTDLLHVEVSQDVLDEYAAKGYPMYVPVASVFQTGTGYLYEGERVYSETVRPFEIDGRTSYEMDLSKYIVIPDGFSYTVKSISQPTNGSISGGTDDVYTYTHNGGATSGKFIVTLQVTKDDNAFKVEDVELVFEFKIKESSSVLERTVYTYTSDTMYTSATAAYESGYAGYATVTEEDNVNPTQNSNTDVWVPNPGSNAVMEIKGKIQINSDGKYRIAIRGRHSVALYISLDGVNYSLAGKIDTTGTSPNFYTDDETTYSDYNLKKGDWVYFKEVLVVDYSGAFIGMGMGKFNGEDVSISYATGAYTQSSTFTKFTTDYVYKTTYKVNYSKSLDTPTIVSYNYTAWDDTKSIENLFDEDATNYIHSDRTDISADNPFEITLDYGKSVYTNTLVFYGESSRKYFPKTGAIYAGDSVDDMKLLCEFTNAAVSNNNVTINFAYTQARYFKVSVTETYAKDNGAGYAYICFRTLKFSTTLTGGRLISLDDDMLTFKGTWKITNEFSTFGHLYEGISGSSVKFEFEGTGFALFAMRGNFGKFRVYVDGKKVATVDLSSSEEEYKELVYSLQDLAEGKHTVEIKGSSHFNLDSIGYFE